MTIKAVLVQDAHYHVQVRFGFLFTLDNFQLLLGVQPVMEKEIEG